MIDPGLKDRVVLVTGGNHGIGAAIAKALARQGASIFITYLSIQNENTGRNRNPSNYSPGDAAYAYSRAQSANHILFEIQKMGGKADALEIDLSKSTAIPTLYDQAEESIGPVEILVNNAAHWELDSLIPSDQPQTNPLPELWTRRHTPLVTAQSHDRHFAVNSRAVALMMAEFTHRHSSRGAMWGRIINISTSGAAGFAGEVSYGASKAALESFSRAAAKELGQFGITVNIVSPGPIQTNWITPALETQIVESTPLGRIGFPDDVADVVVFLASEQARWVTGQILHVGGGHYI
jgi:3-oxoacyl-[acyl-carrier protein] reductase